MTFYRWLGRQAERQDTVGEFARYALRDKAFPQTASKLVIFLQRYDFQPEQREAVKRAHAEWRRYRHEMRAKVGVA